MSTCVKENFRKILTEKIVLDRVINSCVYLYLFAVCWQPKAIVFAMIDVISAQKYFKFCHSLTIQEQKIFCPLPLRKNLININGNAILITGIGREMGDINFLSMQEIDKSWHSKTTRLS